MPYVNISLTRGKSREYLQGVSNAVHQALVEGLGMDPDDRFQAITQHDPGDLVYPRQFRGGPRSGDFIVFTIIDGLDAATLPSVESTGGSRPCSSRVPGQGRGRVRDDAQLTPPENYSFAGGESGSDIAANEARERATTDSGARDGYTRGGDDRRDHRVLRRPRPEPAHLHAPRRLVLEVPPRRSPTAARTPAPRNISTSSSPALTTGRTGSPSSPTSITSSRVSTTSSPRSPSPRAARPAAHR